MGPYYLPRPLAPSGGYACVCAELHMVWRTWVVLGLYVRERLLFRGTHVLLGPPCAWVPFLGERNISHALELSTPCAGDMCSVWGE